MSYKIIHWKGSDMILSTHLVSSGGLLLLSIISLTQGGNLCSECDGQVNPFFTSLASPLLPDESSLQVGERTCTAARRVLGCYFDCELADGSVFEKVSYLYSPAVSTEANTINEWWRVNCEDGCRMADTLSCEHLTYNTTSDCSNIAQWRSCVDEALADYTCDGFCQVSDRWNKAYRLHHEIDCADASSVCLKEVKTCLKDVLSHRNSIGSSISYVMAWEFFYNGAGLSKEFRCQLYSEAEDCFTVYKSAGSPCHRESDLERLRLMMSTAYNDYCNSTVDIEDICFGQDFTSSTTTTSTTSSTSTTTTTTTPSTTSTFADTTTTSSQGQVATLVEVTSARGTCEYCDESATYYMQIASLHEHPNFNLKEFGDIGCRNYTAAANCYKNCSVAGRPSNNYTSPIYRALQSQLVLTCDPTCRHLDLWLCESYLTTSDWCKEGEYERWLTCYEDGAADYLCNGACNLAQRRVNTYKLAREVVCTVSREVESRECISAVNQCLNIKYSKTDMNFENFLTADISSENSCEYFVAGSDCLGGLTNEFENNKTINDLCTTQREREAIRKIGEHWRSMYHHDDCVSQIDGKRRGQNSGTSYQSICEASDFNGTADATCDMLNVLEPGAECVLYSADKSCANPCRNLNPFNCAQREKWGECTSMHAADTSCNGLCSETERANAITTLTSSIHCNVPGQQPDFCMEAIQWSCMSELWVSSQDFVFDLFTQPKESLQSWCGKVEQMKHCFYNATYHQVRYFNRELTRPCASYADYMRSLIQLTSNLTTSTCQSLASTWQQTCPGSDIVIDTPKISQADACPDDIVSIETCSVLQPHLCGNNFDRWTDCLAEEGVFSQCPSLCSANRRRAFATYVEGFIVCHMDRTSEDFCWEYVANECLLGLFGDRTFTKIINVDTEGTVTEMCQMMNNFRKCLADGKSENVTTVDLQIRSPCARQSHVIDATLQLVSNWSMTEGVVCSNPSAEFSNACDSLLAGDTPPVVVPELPSPVPSSPTEECVTDFKMADIEDCDSRNNAEDCSIGFPNWETCVEEASEGCSGLCTPALRSKFINTLEKQVLCSLPSTGMCHTSVKKCFAGVSKDLTPSTGFVLLQPATSVQDVCSTLEGVVSCLNNTVYGSVALPGSQDSILSPCDTSLQSVNGAVQQLKQEIVKLRCSDSSAEWNTACPTGHRLIELSTSEHSVEVIPARDLYQQPANHTYDIRGVADVCTSCQSTYEDIDKINCEELEALMSCLNECTDGSETYRFMQKIRVKTVQELACNPQCPMMLAKRCIDQYINVEGQIPCDSVEDYRECVVRAMSSYDCMGMCTPAQSFYYQETTISHAIRCELSGICRTAVDNVCFNMATRDRWLGMNQFTTTPIFCGLANDFSTCISNSMLSTLTLPESGQTLTTPCADQIRETQAVEQQFLGSLDRRKCVRSNSIWSNVCKNIVVEAFTSSTSSTTTSTTQSTTTYTQSSTESSTALPSVSTPPGPGYTLAVSMLLEADYEAVVGGRTNEVKSQIKQEVAQSLAVPKSTVTNLKISPGSIKVEFDLITDDQSVATSAANTLRRGLPPVEINGVSYVAQPATVEIVSSSSDSSSTFTPPTYCSVCRQQLSQITDFDILAGNPQKEEYKTEICRKFSAAISCFDECVERDNSRISPADASLVRAKQLFPIWCETDCAFANVASCYASERRCSNSDSNTFVGCLLEDSKPHCGGVCTPHQRYSLAQKIQRVIECFPTRDIDCSSHISACFGSLREDGLDSLSKLVWGPVLSPSNQLKDICSYLTVPVNCLLNTDFTNVCTADESSVRKLADKWKQNFHDDVCTDDQEQTLQEKCAQDTNTTPSSTAGQSTRSPKLILGSKAKNKITENAANTVFISNTLYICVSVILFLVYV